MTRARWVLALLLAATSCTSGDASMPAASPVEGETGPAVHLVGRGDLTSVLTLNGVVAPAEPLPLVSAVEGTVTYQVPEGATVPEGQIVAEVAGDSIVAPQEGVVAGHTLPEGADVRAGDVVVTLQPGAFEVVAPVDPVLLYRLYDEPERVVARIDRGPAPFDCPLVSLGADPEQLRLGNPLDAPIHLRCTVPDGVRVFPGVRVTVAVTTGATHDALLVPVVAVEGRAESGRVWVVGEDGTSSPREVSLGLTDGHRVEVLDGLEVGERILAVAPGFTGPSSPEDEGP